MWTESTASDVPEIYDIAIALMRDISLDTEITNDRHRIDQSNFANTQTARENGNKLFSIVVR